MVGLCRISMAKHRREISENKKEKNIKKEMLARPKTWKRRFRQKGASRWTENPKGQSRQKLEAQKIYSRWTENPKGRSRQKLAIQNKSKKQWLLKRVDGRIHYAGSEMATFSKIPRSRVDFLPQKAPVTTLYWAYHIKWLDQALKDAISHKDCRVPYCETVPLSILFGFVSFHRVT